MRIAFPQEAMDRQSVMDALQALKTADADWQHGRVPLFVFKGNDTAGEVGQAAFDMYFTENALGRVRAFPSLKRMEDEIVGMALDLFQAPDDAQGFMTTGGTESIIMAVEACRNHARAQRREPGHRGNIVAARSVHPAFDKAARLMDLEVRRTPVGADYRADPAALADAIDADTIMIVGSAPCFPFGVIDPIAALSELALSRNIWLHVDACVGGYLAPFVKAAGWSLPDFDFAIPGVSSLSADLHKFGYTPKPASTVFYRSADLARHHGFDFDRWPNGRFATTTIVGTRPGGAVAGAWATIRCLGREGYTAIATDLMGMIERYKSGISSIGGLQVLGRPHLSIVAFAATAPGLDIFAVAEMMKEKGWVPGLLQEPKAIHRMMSMLHAPSCEQFLADLAGAVTKARASQEGSSLDATY